MKTLNNTAIIFLMVSAIGIFFFIKNYINTSSKKLTRHFGEGDLRDFYRYECKNRKRIGGKPGCVKAVPDALYR